MRFERTFRVDAPLRAVRSFHRSAASLRSITPPVVLMTGVAAPDPLAEGDAMAFTLWMGPLPVRWHARIERVTAAGFDDVQTSGPFAAWRHEHRFEALGPHATEVRDRIDYRYRRHLLWGPVGLLMARGLPLLFWYRARRTRALLEPPSD